MTTKRGRLPQQQIASQWRVRRKKTYNSSWKKGEKEIPVPYVVRGFGLEKADVAAGGLLQAKFEHLAAVVWHRAGKLVFYDLLP